MNMMTGVERMRISFCSLNLNDIILMYVFSACVNAALPAGNLKKAKKN